MIDISICIANYNGQEVLEPCLESVFAQVTNASYEVIVHDDASTDHSFIDAIRKFPGVIKICSDINIGYCKSSNCMAALAFGDFLLFLNNDVELLPGALEALYQAARATPWQVLSLAEYRMDGAVSCVGMGLDIFFTPYHCDSYCQQPVFVMGACLFVSGDLWREVGGYPEKFEYTGEDLYVCLSALALGASITVLKESGYKHHIGHSLNRKGFSLQRRKISERNRRFIISTMLPRHERLVVRPLFELMFILEMTLHAFRTKSLASFSQPPALQYSSEPTVRLLSKLDLRASKVRYFLSQLRQLHRL